MNSELFLFQHTLQLSSLGLMSLWSGRPGKLLLGLASTVNLGCLASHDCGNHVGQSSLWGV
jgi:hypothetical protein